MNKICSTCFPLAALLLLLAGWVANPTVWAAGAHQAPRLTQTAYCSTAPRDQLPPAVAVTPVEVFGTTVLLQLELAPCTVAYLAGGGDPTLVSVSYSTADTPPAGIISMLQSFVARYAQDFLRDESACSASGGGLLALVTPENLFAATMEASFGLHLPLDTVATVRCG